MSKITLVFISNTTYFSSIQQELSNYTIVNIDSTDDYMNNLINYQVAMIFVDSQHPDWERFTTAPKISPATRRIPVIVVTDVPEQSTNAMMLGTDFTLTLTDFNKQAIKLIKDYGRIPAPELLEQLECDCKKALPPLAVEGVKKFNAGEYYSQHDLFEELWVNTQAPVRDLYRAILQVGVAYFQIERGNYRGALKMLQRSVQWLTILPNICQTVNVEQLQKDSYVVRAELERLGEDRLDEFDKKLLKPVQIIIEE